jgi:hypothetical protein
MNSLFRPIFSNESVEEEERDTLVQKCLRNPALLNYIHFYVNRLSAIPTQLSKSWWQLAQSCYSEGEFRERFRMFPSTFQRLADQIAHLETAETAASPRGRPKIYTVEHRLAMLLYHVSRPTSALDLSDQFGVPQVC